MIEPGLYNYWIVVCLMMTGFYVVMARGNLIKKIVGLNIFQTSVFILYISMGVVTDATAPILSEDFVSYSNPLPHVLILTAIVVGVATTSLGLALVVRIREAYGSIEELDIQAADSARELIEQERHEPAQVEQGPEETLRLEQKPGEAVRDGNP